ncbi:MAG: Lrp/AsnC family transcriptional regulator [Candidatus Hermodarchaeota archaeon]
MDDLDFKIITKLQENAKLSYKEIAKILKSPTSTIHFRVQKMIEEKIIVKFTSIIDVGKLGYETVGWVGLTIDPLKTEEIANKIASFEEVRMVSITGGAHNLVVQILSKNEKELWNFIRENIQTINGVQNLDVSSSLKIFKWDTYYFFNIPE